MKIKKTYKDYSKAYDRLSQVSSIYQNLKNAHVNEIIENTREGDKILDFGAGTGNATLEYLSRGRSVDAIDISDDMIDILKEKCGNYSGLRIIRGDLLDLQKRDFSKYDAVNMMNVLYHLKNPLNYLKEIYKIMNPGGIITVSGPHKNISAKRLFEEIRKDLVRKGKFKEYKEDFERCYDVNKNKLVPNAKLYDKDELKELFYEAGFEKLIKYDDSYYDGHNFFAVFKK